MALQLYSNVNPFNTVTAVHAVTTSTAVATKCTDGAAAAVPWHGSCAPSLPAKGVFFSDGEMIVWFSNSGLSMYCTVATTFDEECVSNEL